MSIKNLYYSKQVICIYIEKMLLECSRTFNMLLKKFNCLRLVDTLNILIQKRYHNQKVTITGNLNNSKMKVLFALIQFT